MTWNAHYDESLKLIELVYLEAVSARDLQEATSFCVALGREKGTNNYLVDAVKIELFATLTDIYDLPTKQYVAEAVDRSTRVAVLLPRLSRSQDAAYFYETVCRNRGWKVQVFALRQDAIDWLLAEHSI